MKKVHKFIILFLMIINMFKISSVNAATNPYAQTGPYGTNCTWYAWKMAYEKAGVSLPSWSDAKNWYNEAKKAGYTVGTTPKPNSIVVWGSWTSYGHVGYVESVGDNVINVWDSTGPCIDEEDAEYRECMANGVSEESDKICKANAKRIACEYTISPDLYGITGFIYLDNPPSTPTTTTTKKKETTTSTTSIKSNNTNLKDIVLSVATIEFDKELQEYEIEVENEIRTLSINATAEDKKATVNGIGNHELNTGLNEIKLTVTAEDGSTKEYIIKVTRNKSLENEKTNQPKESVTKKDNKQSIIISIICILILLTSILIFVFKKNNHNKKIKKKKINNY